MPLSTFMSKIAFITKYDLFKWPFVTLTLIHDLNRVYTLILPSLYH